MIQLKVFHLTVAMMLTIPTRSTDARPLGPDWDEIGDAGATPLTAQRVYGTGSLQSISGILALGGVAGNDDDSDMQDMYLVRLEQPTVITFSASTDPDLGGSSEFDTRLWLFDASGLGLLANDDAVRGDSASTLLDASTDGTGVVVTDPGLYFLAISGAGVEPLSGDDDDRGPLFFFATPTEISGPDGPGGNAPIDDWSIDGELGAYVITFTGVGYISPGDLDGDGVVGAADLASLLSSWGSCPSGNQVCLADLNLDGQVGPADLSALLANWS